jgi:hypothetical protein
MRKDKLTGAVIEVKAEFKNVLQTIYDVLNSGQKKKILKNEKVKAKFDLYCVETEETE